MTAFRRFTEWCKARVWAKLYRLVLDELGARGELDWSRCAIDSVSVRALPEATGVPYIQIEEFLTIARTVYGTEHSVRDMGLLASAIEWPRTNVFGAELIPRCMRRRRRCCTPLPAITR